MKPKKPEANQPRGHVFDGIFEYDNDLPRWWVVMFFITIVFSIAYMFWYHSGLFSDSTLESEYAEELTAAKSELASKGADSETTTAVAFDYTAASKDPATVAAGKAVFQTSCAPCHGTEGQGVIGPNLTDDFWIHGSTPAELEKVILNGVLAKGMPAWGEVLGKEKVRQTLAYIITLQGTNQAGAKPPQGEPGRLK